MTDDRAAPEGIFVYGTLRRGAPNHALVAHARRIEPATARGALYALPQGYPALVPEEEGEVAGELLAFDDLDAVLERLDDFEGVDPASPETGLYVRRAIEVALEGGRRARAWAYVNTPAAVRAAGAPRIEGGSWA